MEGYLENMNDEKLENMEDEKTKGNIDTRNIDELKKYLQAKGLDEAIAELAYFSEKFRINRDDGTRCFIYSEDENSKIKSYIEDKMGYGRRVSEIRVRKEGKAIVIEEISIGTPRFVHYSIDEPIGDDVREVDASKVTTYIDEEGKDVLAQESRTYTSTTDKDSTEMPTEKVLYSPHAKVDYQVMQEKLKTALDKDRNSETPGGYQTVEHIKGIIDLQHRNHELEETNTENLKRLSRTLEFCDKVRQSTVGKIFFGRDAKKLPAKNELTEGREER